MDILQLMATKPMKVARCSRSLRSVQQGCDRQPQQPVAGTALSLLEQMLTCNHMSW